MLDLTFSEGAWSISFNGIELLYDKPGARALSAGIGRETIAMHHGNFEITDVIEKRFDPQNSTAVSHDAAIVIRWNFDNGEICCTLSVSDGRLEGRLTSTVANCNRFWLRLAANPDEAVWGCGEQFSYFNLRGEHFPLWTREQGVGRNKTTAITQMADADDHAGGDYHTTCYPQTTFVSSRRYWWYADTFAYADFDFSQDDCHILYFWELPRRIVWSVKSSLALVVSDLSALLGRQPPLPQWVHDGIILGVQDGTDACLTKLQKAEEHGIHVSGVWAQDWQGQNHTSFGKRLLWNWQWNQKLYPHLDRVIVELAKRDIHFLGYINPYLLKDYPLCEEAVKKGFVVLRSDGEPYYVDFGEFFCAIVDFTNEEAFTWYTSVIQKNLINFGLSGWMADFGEYLPTDAVLFSGMDPRIAHNAWPGLWARLNREAVDKSGHTDVLFFMRAGNVESLRYCPMIWAGDQNVDWSQDDGLPSVITGALSLAMSGMGLHHSDIGGYTTLYGLQRSKELLFRWAELAAFTPLMRTHEGNRPDKNWQFDSDAQTLDHMAYCTRLFVALKEYRIDAVNQNTQHGLPVMRPLCLHYEEKRFFATKDCYLFGRDLLVAPVITEGACTRTVDLPSDEWVHLFTGEQYRGGKITVAAPFRCVPVFYRKQSPFAALFASMCGMHEQ